MKYLSTLLFISLISISLFGFMIFNYNMNHVDGGCIASTVDGTSCPQDMINFGIHKIIAIQTFSTTLISAYFNLSIMLSVLTFSLFLFLIYKKLKYFKIQFLSQKWRSLSSNFYKNKLKFIYWLSLLKNSPAI